MGIGSNPYEIRIPRPYWGGQGADMSSRLATWNWRWDLPSGKDSLVLDFTGVDFMEPWALTMFTCYGLTAAMRHGVPFLVRLDEGQPSNKYLRQMGLREVITTGKSTAEWDDSDQNTGLHVLRTHGDVTRFVKSVTVLGKVETMRATLDALQYGMAELGRNVIQHASTELGGIALAQYYPVQRRVQVAICDAGIGVRKSLSRTYPEATTSDLHALKMALLPHVSGAVPEGTYAGNENAGLGLFFCKEICWRTGGAFWILSNAALVGVRDNDESGSSRIYRPYNSSPWPGTVVVMDIPETGVTEAGFDAILQICRELAAKARETREQHYLDFLDEGCDFTGCEVVPIAPIVEDVEMAKKLRLETLIPSLGQRMLVLDFAGIRFATQSFVHVLLSEVFKDRKSVSSLSFVNCSKATEEAIRTVAAYSLSFRPLL